MPKIVRNTLIAVVLLAVAGTVAARHFGKKGNEAPFRTVVLSRTNLVAAISATGTVEPEEVVDIGAQVAGQVSAFGTDEKGKSIDYGSAVEQGTVLARIDDSLYAADVASAKAILQQAKANQVSAQANVVQTQAKLVQAEQDWKRAQKLGPSEALAPTAYDQYRSAYEVAKANVGVSQAAVEQANATLAQAQANLARSERNLSYCTIKSPVKGVIIDRRVNIGQTVVSSLNAPSLFLLAKDLRRIQVWVSVNEADIGHIHPGMATTFTVDAFPGKVFHGQVGKVRLNAMMTQNVVTYTVEVVTDNSDGKLLPYLTANAQFITADRTNVLAVPNAALALHPRPEQIAPEFRHAGAPPKRQGKQAAEPNGNQRQGTLWVEEGEYLKPVTVRLGLNDGAETEVQAPELREGLSIAMSEQSGQNFAGGSAPGASPFTPQLGRARANSAPGGNGGAPAR